MNKVSRRALARYCTDELLAGATVKYLAPKLASVLVENNKQGEVEFLVSDIAWELESRGELVVGNITSATSLSEELKKALSEQLKKATKTKAVLIRTNIDKSVIGGIRVETAGRIWDDTVAKKLNYLREVF